jgi:hypothetical protein
MTARNAVDPDLWWHLRTGQWIIETGHIPRSDPFSFTRAGSPWVSHEWLSEVTFYEIWKHSGAAGLIIFSAIVTTAGFMLLYLRSPGKPHWAAVTLLLGALAAAPVWGVRPQMFTFVLASLLLWLLDRGQERPCLLIWIPLLFLLWLNLHAGFALGPVLLVAYSAGLIWEVAAGDTSWQEVRLLVPHGWLRQHAWRWCLSIPAACSFIGILRCSAFGSDASFIIEGPLRFSSSPLPAGLPDLARPRGRRQLRSRPARVLVPPFDVSQP